MTPDRTTRVAIDVMVHVLVGDIVNSHIKEGCDLEKILVPAISK